MTSKTWGSMAERDAPRPRRRLNLLMGFGPGFGCNLLDLVFGHLGQTREHLGERGVGVQTAPTTTRSLTMLIRLKNGILYDGTAALNSLYLKIASPRR